ncbi:lysyl-tRNA synthetase [Klebsiella aerogenes]|nr:lysyl-tRNA synthetase [Klebsiella aerogenes]
MSEQQAQGADEAIDLNNELKTRREKLAALREQGVAFPNDFRRDHTLTNCMLNSMRRITMNSLP